MSDARALPPPCALRAAAAAAAAARHRPPLAVAEASSEPGPGRAPPPLPLPLLPPLPPAGKGREGREGARCRPEGTTQRGPLKARAPSPRAAHGRRRDARQSESRSTRSRPPPPPRPAPALAPRRARERVRARRSAALGRGLPPLRGPGPVRSDRALGPPRGARRSFRLRRSPAPRCASARPPGGEAVRRPRRAPAEHFLPAARLFPQPSLPPPLAGSRGGPAPQRRSRQPLEGRGPPANRGRAPGPTSVFRRRGAGALGSRAGPAPPLPPPPPPVRSRLPPRPLARAPARPRGAPGRSQRICPPGSPRGLFESATVGTGRLARSAPRRGHKDGGAEARAGGGYWPFRVGWRLGAARASPCPVPARSPGPGPGPGRARVRRRRRGP
ncbi:basic proline-rich protein-like [Cricetulus griseus]|uniref:Basic proline-rich protein-like n=1 Tax=Cricetulus griseus TaxID=10029 RepID=A0A9J7FQ89_CRIGR|nr:basic proline-rich protein-like [Cricetulus griseus]